MTILEGKEAIKINGKEYWSVKQFAELSQRTEYTIRMMISKGNSIRKLQSINITGRRYVPVDELFEFPFIANGRPPEGGFYVERFYLDEKTKELLKTEEKLSREEKTEE